MEFIGDWRGAL